MQIYVQLLVDCKGMIKIADLFKNTGLLLQSVLVP